MSKKICNSYKFFFSNHLRIASTFSGSIRFPLMDIMWPRYQIPSTKNTHLLSFANNECYLNSSNTEHKCSLCYLHVLLFMSMLSRKTTINFPKYGCNTVSISVINDVNALVKPNVITKNLSWSKWVLNVVFGTSCSLIHT